MTDELEQLKKQQDEIQRQIDVETAKLQNQNNQTATQTKVKQETYNGRIIEFRNHEYKINSVIQGFKTIEQAKAYIDDLSKSAPSVQKNNELSANEKKWIGILLIVFIFVALFIFAKKNSDDNNLMNFNNPEINQTNKNNFLIGLCTFYAPEWVKYKCNSNLVSRTNEMAISVSYYEEKALSTYVFFGAECRNSPLPPSACKNKKYFAPVEYVIESDGAITVYIFASECRVPSRFWMQNGILYEGYAGEASGNCKQEQLISVQRLKQKGSTRVYYTRDLPN